jgi:SagB-type dehydrogenase family enzyme
MPVALASRFRRAPHVVCYWAAGGLTFHNYASGVRVMASPLACQILDFFDAWRPATALIAAFATFEPDSLHEAIGELVQASLLDVDGDREAASARGAAASTPRDLWEAWNPAAGFFHTATKNVAYAEVVAQGTRGEHRGVDVSDLSGQEWHPKEYPHAPVIALPPPRVSGQFPEVLLARRTWRRFNAAPVACGDLATLLQLTFGVQRWRELPGRGPLPFKTSPSGGACHPLEAYLLARNVDGLDAGWYHYNPTAHALSRLDSAGVPTADQVTSYLPTQPWYGDAAAIVFMAAVFARSQARYRYARAYRSVLIEAGHLCQTFCLVSTWLGLAPFCTAALADSRIDATLGLDGMKESVLYAAGVGTRPAGVDWALYPAGLDPARDGAL